MIVLFFVLTCLIVLQQVNQAMLAEYMDFCRQRQLLVSQIIDFKRRKCPKKKRKRRRFWVRPGRTSAWWDNFLNGSMLEEEWRENFRMSRKSFFELSTELRPYIERETTHMRTPISVETQVAILLYYLADEGRMRKVANSFGVSRASCSIIVRRVSKVITRFLGPKYIKLPMTEASVKEKV